MDKSGSPLYTSRAGIPYNTPFPLKRSVSVIIPSYNERENIPILVRQVEALLAGVEHEILVVDDMSPDGTGAVVEELAKTVPGLRLLVKKDKAGIGSALRYGYDRGRHEVLLSMDADLSYDTKEAAKLLALIDDGCDLALGCRHQKGGTYEAPNLRIKLKFLISRMGNRVIQKLLGMEIHDYSANFRAIKRDVWKALETRQDTNSLLLEMILEARYRGFQVRETVISFKDRVHGESKLNLMIEAPKFLVNLLKYAFTYRVLGVSGARARTSA